MLLNRDGRFKARLIERGVGETGPNKLVTFTARFLVEQEYRDGDWCDVTAENAEITGYFYLEKKDGSINTIAIDQLKAGLGWDGRDPFWLEDADLADLLVQITVAMESYDGKTRAKVKWIDHADAEPTRGVQRAEGAARTAIANRLGPKLRANAGGSPRPAPVPTAPKPSPTAPRAPKAPAPRANVATADEAWAVFNAAFPNENSPGERERQWFKMLAEMFPDRDLAELTADEWNRVAEEAPNRIVPF